MLKNWTSHAEYQQFIISTLSSFHKTFPKRIVELEPSISKLYCLNLDILGEILKPHYSNFISRLWLSELSSDKIKLKRLYLFKKKPCKTEAPDKNKKLPNKHPDIVKNITNFFYNDRSFAGRAEKLLQKILTLVAVKPSFDLDLIQQKNRTIACDCSCVHCHSSYYGTKVCKYRENNIYYCKWDHKLPDKNLFLYISFCDYSDTIL